MVRIHSDTQYSQHGVARRGNAALTIVLYSQTVVGGPRYARSVVLARSQDSYSLRLYGGGQVTFVRVNGDGDSDLDCFLYDENGNEVDRDDDETDQCRLVVQPRWTATFRLVIKNFGVANSYTLETN